MHQDEFDAAGKISQEKLFDNPNVLLVEDSRVNREFVLEMLESIGCIVTTAENGKVAIQKILNAQFDLVLMDIQMPEMDGYEATRLVRQMTKAKEIPHSPIIALTANDMNDDREKCLAAGMDDYVTKPIKKQQLIDSLLKWIPESKHREHNTSDNTIIAGGDAIIAVGGSNYEVLDMATLSEMRDLMQGKFSNFIKLYLEDAASCIKTLKQLGEKDTKANEITLPAHTLKSTSKQVGALQLAYIAEELETRSSELTKLSSNSSTLLPLIVQLEKLYDEVKPLLLKNIVNG